MIEEVDKPSDVGLPEVISLKYANAVELSPIQRLELLEAHSTYLDDLEELQNGRMKRFVDSGIGLVSDFEPWGGKFTIPPRRDIDAVIREGRPKLKSPRS